jgi:hypothetical protein
MLPVICFYRLEITFDGDVMNGVACNLESRGYHALCKATKEIVGQVEPYSITGSLPLIRELQVWELMRRLTFWALSPLTKANSLSNFYRMKDLMFKQLDMVSACISKKTNSFFMITSFTCIKCYCTCPSNVATAFTQAYWRRTMRRMSTACFQTWPRALRCFWASFHNWKKRSEPSCWDRPIPPI